METTKDAVKRYLVEKIIELTEKLPAEHKQEIYEHVRCHCENQIPRQAKKEVPPADLK